MKRETGLYWIRLRNSPIWEVARYNEFGEWELLGTECWANDSELSEINETKIVRN